MFPFRFFTLSILISICFSLDLRKYSLYTVIPFFVFVIWQKYDLQIEAGFWAELSRLKLEKWKLSTEAVPISGSFYPSSLTDFTVILTTNSLYTLPPSLNENEEQKQESNLPHGEETHAKDFRLVPGQLFVVNTMEVFFSYFERILFRKGYLFLLIYYHRVYVCA